VFSNKASLTNASRGSPADQRMGKTGFNFNHPGISLSSLFAKRMAKPRPAPSYPCTVVANTIDWLCCISCSSTGIGILPASSTIKTSCVIESAFSMGTNGIGYGLSRSICRGRDHLELHTQIQLCPANYPQVIRAWNPVQFSTYCSVRSRQGLTVKWQTLQQQLR